MSAIFTFYIHAFAYSTSIPATVWQPATNQIWNMNLWYRACAYNVRKLKVN